jgi:hypothetical protein
MAAEKKRRRIQPVELLEMLDLEERKILASEMHLTLPANLNDRAFEKSIAAFSATTLLQVIVRLRMSTIEMLKDIYQFLEQEHTTGRTTVRAVLLPDAQDALQKLFSSAMKEALVTALDRKDMLSSIDGLERLAEELRMLVTAQMEDIKGASVRRGTHISDTIDKSGLLNPFHPDRRKWEYIAHHFAKQIVVYDPQDIERVQTFSEDFEAFFIKVEDILYAFEKDALSAARLVQTVREELEAIQQALQGKLYHMKVEQAQRGETREEIDEPEWEELLEKTRVFKETFLAACHFEMQASLLYDFLNLDLWRERWRIYELWMLTHLLQLFQGLGFTVDTQPRVKRGVWNLKFTKDKNPIALLHGQGVNLKVYYQLYSKEAKGGNMPDIAIQKEDKKYLVILDPKYGESYKREELEKVGLRYANATKFSPDLTVIHNFYAMSSYTYDVISTNPRCLLVSNVRPGSSATAALDAEIIAHVPPSWLPLKKSVVLLVDSSGSIQQVQERIVKAVEQEFQGLRSSAFPGATLMLFSDSVDKEILFSEVQDIRHELAVSGRGTNLASGLNVAIEKVKAMPAPRTVIFFTDGGGNIDIAFMSQKLRAAEVHLKIYEAGASDTSTLLQNLSFLSEGEYYHI